MQTPLSLSAKPPALPFLFQKQASTALLTTLNTLNPQISTIYATALVNKDDEAPPQLDQTTYLNIYNTAHNFSLAIPACGHGNLLYTYLDSEIRAYCINTQEFVFEGKKNDGDEKAARNLLSSYMSAHRKFAALAKLVGNLLQGWERRWLRRRRHEEKISVASVEELHKVVWRNEVLGIGAESDKGVQELVDAVGLLRDTEGGVSEFDSLLARDVVRSLSSTGLTLDS